MDPISAGFLFYLFVNLECRYRSQKVKMLAYKTAFEGTSALVSDVNSTHNRLSSVVRPEFRARINRELQRTRLALEIAQPVVDRKRGRFKWVLQHPGSAKAHMQLLSQCHNTLLAIFGELVRLDERQSRDPRLENYFQDFRSRMFAALASQVSRDAIVNSGAGDRMRLIAHETPLKDKKHVFLSNDLEP